MLTYLLTWNPKWWGWDSIDKDIKSIRKKGYSDGTWSCGGTKRIVPGDRIFLMKLGVEPRGIVASGWATSSVYEDVHWDDDLAVEGKLTRYIDVHFDTILKPEEKLLSRNTFSKPSFAEVNWSPRSSGVSIPEDIANLLEKEWARVTGNTIPATNLILPEEAGTEPQCHEGSVKQISVNRYERSAEARTICIKHNGHDCVVCGINFEKLYGKIGKEYIHVHHLLPLSDIGEDYTLSPINDLTPVCPNCHAMLHKRTPPYSVKELRRLINRQQ